MKDSNLYICYSIPLQRKIQESGIHYNVIGLSINQPHHTFWVYEKSDTLNCILTNWTQNNRK